MADNPRMDKMAMRQIVAKNIRNAMARDPSIDTQEKLAARSGLGQSTISRLLLCEASPNVDALLALAKPMRCQPWELLVDEESTRRAAIERMLGRDGAPDIKVELPQKVSAMRRKKRGA